MDTRAFLGLRHNPFRWTLEVRPEVCTTGQFLFGGAGLGAAIGSLEGTSGRDLVWATGQYLSYAERDQAVIDLEDDLGDHVVRTGTEVDGARERPIFRHRHRPCIELADLGDELPVSGRRRS